ncbi:MAG TPA: glycoside hydrolase family 88 protein [Verrucomicrobiales bacterium]|nr:glycoside hydrolase family 88 protein [Verrucomicrobiales bacterium]
MFCRLLFATIILLLPLAESSARDWFVNPETGRNDLAGSEQEPLGSVQAAFDSAGPGDRVIFLPRGAVYRESVNLRDNKNGIVIEGNGVTLSGADPLDKQDWEDLGEDLHRVRLPSHESLGELLVQNGEVFRLPREASYPAATDLKAGEFRIDQIDPASLWLTVRGATTGWEWGVRENGFTTSGVIRNIKIFNLKTHHFLNNGFNVEGNSRGLQFFSISGSENLADGFSANDTSECWINDSEFFKNGNGVADVNGADTYYTGCRIGMNEKSDVLLTGGRHSLNRCLITSQGAAVPLLINHQNNTDSGKGIGSTSLIMQRVEFDFSYSENPLFSLGPVSHVFHDTITGESIRKAKLSIHPSSEIRESLYHVFPIGRDATGTPLMAWAGGGSGNMPSEAYRIIHFGKHVPEEIAQKLSPENDWFGLITPLDTAAFPPVGKAFEKEHSSAHAIWRWIGITAPDAVFVPDTPEGLALGRALQTDPPAGVGMVSIFINRESAGGTRESFVLPNTEVTIPAAKKEMQERANRSPAEVLMQLAMHYGNQYSGSYIDALAIMARRRGGVTDRGLALANAYLKGAPPLPTNGGEIAGTLLFTEFDEPEMRKRVIEIADMAFDNSGNPLPAMPTHHEMSDAIFMACPLLARAGKLSGDTRYYDQCLQHFQFMAERCLRPDGLYRHSPLSEAAWGRGNGFPALGLAIVLQDLPTEHKGFPLLLSAFKDHLRAIAPYQDLMGMWHQIIDYPDSYAELTATCMLGYSIAVGIENGWLDESEWGTRLESAWAGVKLHIATDGKTLMNVCTGTGKQPTLEDYYEREAILGPDSRGGAMAMLFAAEMKRR